MANAGALCLLRAAHSMDAPEAAEHRQSRCSAIESLQAVFRWEHQFAVKMALPGKMPEALILRPQIDRGSGFQPLLGPAKPVLRIADERAKALSYFPGVYRQSGRARGRLFAALALFLRFQGFSARKSNAPAKKNSCYEASPADRGKRRIKVLPIHAASSFFRDKYYYPCPAAFARLNLQCAAAYDFQTLADVCKRDMRLIVLRLHVTGAGIVHKDRYAIL